MRVNVTSYQDAMQRVINWAKTGESRYVDAASMPMLTVVDHLSPFRPLPSEDDTAYTQLIIASKARILSIRFSCPKQKRWIAIQHGKIPAVMLRVGAMSNFYSKRVNQALVWRQRQIWNGVLG